MIRRCVSRLVSSCLVQKRSLYNNIKYYNLTTINSGKKCGGGGGTTLLTVLTATSILGLFKKNDEDEEEEGKLPISFKRHYVMAQMNLADRQYQIAESNYHKALEILQRSPLVLTQPYLEAMAVITYELGELYVVKEDWDKATSNYIETINLMTQCGLSMESSPIIELSLKLGKTFTNKKDYQEAEKTFNFTLSSAKALVLKESNSENLALLGMCYHVKAQYYLMKNDFEQALSCFTLALDTAKSVYGENDIQIAVLMNDCSTALEGLSRFDEADKYLQEAIDLSLLLPLPHDQEHLAILFMNLGAIKNSQGLKEESLNMYKKAQSYAAMLTDRSIYNEIKRRISVL